MGGLAGHMAHLHESLELSFNELATILDSVANADVTATEKVDGQNLFLTVKNDGSINTARNGGDLKRGGMTPAEFSAKWAGHPAETAFTNGFKAISLALKSMGKEALDDLFANGTRYVNMEVMYPGNPNMIVYDAGNVVLHNFQTFDPVGASVDDPEAQAAFQKLVDALDGAQVDIDSETWQVKGPVVVQLQNIASGEALKEVQKAVSRIAAPVGMSGTLGDLVELRFREIAQNAGIPEDKIDDMMDAAFQRPGAPKVTAIKKGLTPEQKKVVSQLATKTKFRKAASQILKPLELAITDFAIEVLRGLESFFVSDTDSELQRQRSRLKSAIKYLEGLAEAGDDKVGELVDRQLQKLTDIENQVNTTMEGIVFEYPPGSGILKKLTGSFAMMNQLVGRAARMGMDETQKSVREVRVPRKDSFFDGGMLSLVEAVYGNALLEEYMAGGKRIGLFPLSAKPYHAGHHFMVEKAASENDEVILFVSTSDRKRKGQYPIMGVDMVRIWQEELEPIMPPNVSIQYGGSPVGNVYKTIEDAAAAGSSDTYVIYSDPVDTARNYPVAKRPGYFDPLYSAGQVLFAAEENPESVTRGEGSPDVSGTSIRAAIESGDYDTFVRGMPAGVDVDNVWSILSRHRI